MLSPVEVRSVEPTILAAVRREVPPGGVAQAWRPALDLVWAFIRGPEGGADLWSGGHNVFLYHHPASPGEPMAVDFGVEVTRDFEPHGEVHSVLTPAGRVASTVYVGPIEGLPAAHQAIEAWCAGHGETAGDASWETYGDWGEDPGTWETRVTYLLA